VPLLITEILGDMTGEEEAKDERFNSLEEFRKELPKTTNHPTIPGRNHDSLRPPQHRKAARQSTKP
jgi:hypothetical protein